MIGDVILKLGCSGIFGPDIFSREHGFDFHPIDLPMDHPRTILEISEPDRDDTIILASSQGLASEARPPQSCFSCDHPSFIRWFRGQAREIDPSSYYHPTFRHSRNLQKAIILLSSYCLREHPIQMEVCKSNHSKYPSSYPVG